MKAVSLDSSSLYYIASYVHFCIVSIYRTYIAHLQDNYSEAFPKKTQSKRKVIEVYKKN